MAGEEEHHGLELSLSLASKTPVSSSFLNHRKQQKQKRLQITGITNIDESSMALNLPRRIDIYSLPNNPFSTIIEKNINQTPPSREIHGARRQEKRNVGDEVAASVSKWKKLRLSGEQATILEEAFKDHSSLNLKEKIALAKELNLKPRQVEVWFQNRRARTKLKQTEMKCEYLRMCYQNLTEENRRLQTEVHELKELKPNHTHLTLGPTIP